MILAIARHQVVALRRHRTFLAFLTVFVVMTALAGLIGWSSHQTIGRVYDASVDLLAAEGKQAPPDPFARVPALALLSNMTVYVPLIGALLAAILGHLTVADEQAAGIGRLIFSRPVPRTTYVLGKLTGTAATLAAVTGVATVTSAVSLVIANGRVPSGADLGRLVTFYGLSWLYLMLFALVGMLATVLSRRRSLGLLSAVSVWLVLTFVVPQFTSGLRPTASLNPVVDPVSTTLTFFQVTARARWLSVSEMYKDVSAQTLGTAVGPPGSDTVLKVASLVAVVVVLGVLTSVAIRRHDYSLPGTP